jgi:hypothetical protein
MTRRYRDPACAFVDRSQQSTAYARGAAQQCIGARRCPLPFVSDRA